MQSDDFFLCDHVGFVHSDWSQNGWHAANWAKPNRAGMTSFSVSLLHSLTPSWARFTERSWVPLLDMLGLVILLIHTQEPRNTGCNAVVMYESTFLPFKCCCMREGERHLLLYSVFSLEICVNLSFNMTLFNQALTVHKVKSQTSALLQRYKWF